VERNRLFLIVKNFPLPELLLAPMRSLVRYFWHFLLALGGEGKAAEFRSEGNSGVQLGICVLRAHWELVACLPALWKRRRGVKRRLTPIQFRQLIRRFTISPRQVARL